MIITFQLFLAVCFSRLKKTNPVDQLNLNPEIKTSIQNLLSVGPSVLPSHRIKSELQRAQAQFPDQGYKTGLLMAEVEKNPSNSCVSPESQLLLFFLSPQRKSKRNWAKQKESHLKKILSKPGLIRITM